MCELSRVYRKAVVWHGPLTQDFSRAVVNTKGFKQKVNAIRFYKFVRPLLMLCAKQTTGRKSEHLGKNTCSHPLPQPLGSRNKRTEATFVTACVFSLAFLIRSPASSPAASTATFALMLLLSREGTQKEIVNRVR